VHVHYTCALRRTIRACSRLACALSCLSASHTAH
jgi:hypothetical protein